MRGAILGAILVLAGPAAGQVPSAAPPPAAAGPDTVTAVLVLPEGAAGPGGWTVIPDTVVFGGPIVAVPAGDEALLLTTETDWLEVVPPEETASIFREEAPAGVTALRVYRVDPFRIAIGDWVSPVIHVRGRVVDPDRIATVRNPRWPGLPWVRFGALALAVLLVALAALWAWNRRRGPAVWPDRELAPAIWLETAPSFRGLLVGGALARGDARGFLDGLAGLARRYVGGRYGIAAMEMTGGEMVAACRRLGYPLGPVRGLAGIIEAADRHRYDPDPPSFAWCREQAVEFYRQVQATRILPRYTAAESERVLAADRAWSEVARELDPTGRLLAGGRRKGA